MYLIPKVIPIFGIIILKIVLIFWIRGVVVWQISMYYF